MTPDQIAALFTRPDGQYRFARWVRPIVPVVFGVQDQTLATVKGAIEALVTLAGHRMAETDPEQGANLMIFFLRDWSEIGALPDLEGLVPGIGAQAARLAAAGASQYRHFRFEPDGAIRACFAFLRIADGMEEVPADDLALALAVQVMLVWADGAFAARPALARAGGAAVLRPDLAALIRVAYDPVMPAVAADRSHALRLAARMAG